MWLADLFHDVASIFYDIGIKFGTIAWWLYGNGWPASLVTFFGDIAEFFDDGHRWFDDIANEIEDLWGWIESKFSDLDNLWNHVAGWITDKINEAYNLASIALTNAGEAWNKAVDATQLAVSEAANALADAKVYALSIVPDIAAWVIGHSLDVYNAIKSYITEFVFVIENYIGIIWGAITGFVTDLIGLAIAPFAQLYNWFELKKELVMGFFDDPLTYILTWFKGIVSDHEIDLLDIVDRIGDTLFKPPDEEGE